MSASPHVPTTFRGTVVDFDARRGYGRIQPSDHFDPGVLISVSRPNLLGERRLRTGDEVQFTVAQRPAGAIAENVRLLRRLPVTGAPTVPFRELRIGLASAERESAESPELLTEGFLHDNELLTSILRGSTFLLVGRKGTGKSAIAQHLLLTAPQEGRLVSCFTLEEAAQLREDNEPGRPFPTSWRQYLLSSLVASFLKDEGAGPWRARMAADVEILQQHHVLAAEDLETAERPARSISRVGIPKVFEVDIDATRQLSRSDVIESLQRLTNSFESITPHLVIIDGADTVLSEERPPFVSISRLVTDAYDVNTALATHGVKAKIVVLCRPDLLDLLPGPNINKIFQDCGRNIEWYSHRRLAPQAKLFELVNLRASLQTNSRFDLVDSYLAQAIPRLMKLGPGGAHQFLLEKTRHTPRDMFMLVKYIQTRTEELVPTLAELLAGLHDYSILYFMPEVADELKGHFGIGEIRSAMKVLGAVQKRDFTIDDIQVAAGREGVDGLAWPMLLHELFNCGAIANIKHVEETNVRIELFIYRNPRSSLHLDRQMTVHRGLWEALDLV